MGQAASTSSWDSPILYCGDVDGGRRVITGRLQWLTRYFVAVVVAVVVVVVVVAAAGFERVAFYD